MVNINLTARYARRRTITCVQDQRSQFVSPSNRTDNQTLPHTQQDITSPTRSLHNLDTVQPASREDSPAMLYAQVAECSINHLQHLITPSARTYFLGEAFSLTYVINEVLAPFFKGSTPNHQDRLHYPIPEASHRRTQVDTSYLEQINILQNRGVYHYLSNHHIQKFLNFYFKWFHPAFPILDQEQFNHDVRSNKLSLLLLNTVLMIAVTICPATYLVEAGIPERYAAREIFYRQAKLLYDEDTDKDKLRIVIGTFLLSFWWGRPMSRKIRGTGLESPQA
ncbi:hypothetical protein BGW36DRAFT_421549 [Talaromyces proteolyticus]|uniref:Xylanolytic transcriptional activator regulatory domain-containing protein n=1 Tax=Talaromyces proteolyticus TaxID=1131652 RepID=A0AAD4Q5V6_9EURO|nr:uncharacterized protein BGW36DRAFT_421549 [Talaromyces proteolyticus]KAH8704968.1 hypothetical protein BGW36DRAFT_421549 [Talaromyces proteolyticus]